MYGHCVRALYGHCTGTVKTWARTRTSARGGQIPRASGHQTYVGQGVEWPQRPQARAQHSRLNPMRGIQAKAEYSHLQPMRGTGDRKYIATKIKTPLMHVGLTKPPSTPSSMLKGNAQRRKFKTQCDTHLDNRTPKSTFNIESGGEGGPS